LKNGDVCSKDCNCINCLNVEGSKEREKFLETQKLKEEAAGSKMASISCRCQKSHCSKGYCECYQAKQKCTSKCGCVSCENDKHSHGSPSEADQHEDCESVGGNELGPLHGHHHSHHSSTEGNESGHHHLYQPMKQ